MEHAKVVSFSLVEEDCVSSVKFMIDHQERLGGWCQNQVRVLRKVAEAVQPLNNKILWQAAALCDSDSVLNWPDHQRW